MKDMKKEKKAPKHLEASKHVPKTSPLFTQGVLIETWRPHHPKLVFGMILGRTQPIPGMGYGPKKVYPCFISGNQLSEIITEHYQVSWRTHNSNLQASQCRQKNFL